MKKIDWRFTLRLVLAQCILTLITFLLLPSLLGTLPGSQVFQWTVLALVCAICYTFLFLDCTVKGSRDISKDEISRKQNERVGKDPEDFVPVFQKQKGLVCAAIAQSPLAIAALVLAVLQAVGSADALLLEALLRGVFMMAAHAFDLFPDGVPGLVFLVLNLLFCLIAWWGYYNGIAQRRRMNLVLARNSARLARRQAIKKGRNKRK